MGRPLILGVLDEKLKKLLMVLGKKSDAVNRVVAVATAKALTYCRNDKNL